MIAGGAQHLEKTLALFQLEIGHGLAVDLDRGGKGALLGRGEPRQQERDKGGQKGKSCHRAGSVLLVIHCIGAWPALGRHGHRTR